MCSYLCINFWLLYILYLGTTSQNNIEAHSKIGGGGGHMPYPRETPTLIYMYLVMFFAYDYSLSDSSLATAEWYEYGHIFQLGL